MQKRKLLAGLLGLAAIPFVAKASSNAEAAKSRGSATFVVPAGVEKIRVRSYVAGDKVLDRELDVQPGQVFKIDPA